MVIKTLYYNLKKSALFSFYTILKMSILKKLNDKIKETVHTKNAKYRKKYYDDDPYDTAKENSNIFEKVFN